MAKLSLCESRLFAVLSIASLCTDAACFPACLLVEIICPYPEPDWAVAVGLGMDSNVVSQCCSMTLEKWANFNLEQGLGKKWGSSRREAFNDTEDPTSLREATLPCASYHSPCIAFGLQPGKTASKLHLLWSCCRVCTGKLWNNLRELRLWAAHSCLTWTVASEEHFTRGLRPELRLLLSSIMEGLRLFQHARREVWPEAGITINWHKHLWRTLCSFVGTSTNISGVAKWWKIPQNWPTWKVALELLWTQKNWASNFMIMSWGLIMRASLGGMTAAGQLAYLPGSSAWGHMLPQGSRPSQCRMEIFLCVMLESVR